MILWPEQVFHLADQWPLRKGMTKKKMSTDIFKDTQNTVLIVNCKMCCAKRVGRGVVDRCVRVCEQVHVKLWGIESAVCMCGRVCE